MASYINTNVASLTAQNNLANSQGGLSQSLERLSSGLRINSAADDAAGLAISTRMQAQINGLNQAAQNANDGISLAQTAGGALTSVAANLQTLRQLAVESANSTNTSSDRQALNAEAQQLTAAIQNTATTTQFNGENLLDGSFIAQQFQVGANANQTISVSVSGATTNTLGVYGGASATTVLAGTGNAWTVSQSIIVNGVTIGASNATSNAAVNGGNAGVSSSSAAAKAAAINAQSSLTGVTATGYTTTNKADGAVTGGTAVPPATATANSSTSSGELWINGFAVGAISASATELGQIQNAANAINAVSTQSGVTAVADASTGELTLTAADGRDIQIATSGTATGGTVGGAAAASAAAAVTAATGLTADVFTASGSGPTGTTGILANGNLDTSAATGVTYGGQQGLFTGALTFDASSSINLVDTSTAGGLAAAGLTGYSSTLTSLSALDISSVTGANAAINIVDAAINQINGQQANLGAIQNRFTSTISNLNTSSTNLSAAQSRIEDTDYAAETANLAHYQILQQAGTAMLAQANSLPNSVLTLLR
jgi:flagellin